MIGKRPLLIGIGIGLIISSLFVTVLSFSDNSLAWSDHDASSGIQQNNDQQNNNLQNSDQQSNERQKTDEQNIDRQNQPNDQNNHSNPSNQSEQSVMITIAPGSTATAIADTLFSQGLIQDKQVFLDRVLERGVAGQFMAGSFELSPGLEQDAIIDQLLKLP